MMWMSLVSGMVSLWGCCVSSMASEFQEPASPAAPAYPDVDAMLEASYEDFQKGAIVGGWDALRHRMRGNIYQSNPNGLQESRLTQFERLVRGVPEDVLQVNREIIEYCIRKKAEIEAAWADPKRRHPAKEVCQYKTELIPLAILPLRIGLFVKSYWLFVRKRPMSSPPFGCMPLDTTVAMRTIT